MSLIKSRNSKFALAGIVAIGACLIGYQMLNRYAQDPDTGEFPSAGYVVAIEQTRNGGRAVLFDENGKRIDAPAPAKDVYDDREVSWSADGQRVFISSNRELDSYNIYRWNPAKNEVKRRSIGSRSQGAPWFWPGADPSGPKLGLIQSGGQIQELDITTGDTSLTLPPTGERIAGVEEGSKGAMEMYDRFGRAFVKARYAGSKDKMFGLMRNDEGYTLIYQPIGYDQEGRPLQPAELFRGAQVELETDDMGDAAVMVKGLAFPPYAEVPEEYIQNGKIVPPFSSGIFRVSVDATGAPNSLPILLLPNDTKEELGEIAVSPDGTKLAVVIGNKLEDGGFEPMGLIVMPFEAGGGNNGAGVVMGAVSSPSWSPDGSKIAYLKRDGENVDVYRVNVDGSGETKLSSGGRWASPVFSPAK